MKKITACNHRRLKHATRPFSPYLLSVPEFSPQVGVDEAYSGDVGNGQICIGNGTVPLRLYTGPAV